jgi:SAM-dependent methyltransferase
MSDRPGFFDHCPEFYDSAMHLGPQRLNAQYHALIESNAHLISGKRILDLASHRGHWSYAILRAGAAHLTGVEGRPEQVARAKEYLAKYSIAPDRYRFVVGDIPTDLKELEVGEYDTIFCMGFLYHTMHHMAVISEIARLKPQTIVIDTAVVTDRWPVVRLSEEDYTHPGSAVAGEHDQAKRVLVGTPSREALRMMLEHAGYPHVEWFDWYGQVSQRWEHLEDYRDGIRASLTATRGDT